MTSTDFDGSPLLILSQREATALCRYFAEENFFQDYHVLSGIWKKAEEVCSESAQLNSR